MGLWFSAYAPLGPAVRLSAGLDPVRPAADAGRRPGRRAQDRLRQHRRHQRAAHRPQGARRRHAGCSTLLKGTVAVLLVYEIAKRFVAFDAYQLSYVAGLGAMLGHIYPVWLRFYGGKGVATFIGVLLGTALAGGGRVRPGLGRRGGHDALFLAGGAVGHRRRRALLSRHRAGRSAVHADHDRAHFPEASRAIFAACSPARRAGSVPSRERRTLARLTPAPLPQAPRRRPAAGLPAPDPQRATSARSPSASSSISSAAPKQALDALPELSRRGGRQQRCASARAPRPRPSWKRPSRIGARPLFTIEPGYPPALAVLPVRRRRCST